MMARRWTEHVEQSDRTDAVPPLLDLVHLARQTAGDSTLAIDLLTLFEAQSRDVLRDLEGSAPADESMLELVHRLKGAARAVGARRVAAAAAAVEGAVLRGDIGEDEYADDLSGLSVALALTLGSLAVVLRGGDLDEPTGLESFKTARY